MLFELAKKSAAALAARDNKPQALIPSGDNFAIVDAWLAVELYPNRAAFHVLPDGSVVEAR